MVGLNYLLYFFFFLFFLVNCNIFVMCNIIVFNHIILYAGELCGDCTGGKPVSVLFNKCTSCSDANTMLIPLLGIRVHITLL